MSESINAALLAAVEVLSEEGDYRRAAQKLRLTPSLLDEQISDLEGRLGFHIFDRIADAVTTTKEGRTFIAASRVFIEELRKTKGRDPSQ